ncbi:MAG TPA: sugar phosphate isomerase/epimerase family protein [Planctomycetota bacterium]|jgi:sugar phosphate isomerase/epimerase
MQGHEDVLIGTMVPGGKPDYLQQVVGLGFESYEFNWWKYIGDVDLKKIADEDKKILDKSGNGAVVSCLGLYGNPLIDKQTAKDWVRAVDACKSFGCDLVTGFAGRVVDKPIPESIDTFKKVFGPIVKRAEDKGVRIAFENCDMGGTWEHGDWNIAHAPAAWEMIFEAIPSPNLGLEWEPCHQMNSLIDPLPQLRKWVHKVFHLHGKDATVLWDVVRQCGIRGGKQYVYHRTPGFGDTNWTDIISILRMGKFNGAIDIEGWHDPVYREKLEMTGQVHALKYLQNCRGGEYVENPKQ